MRKKLLYYFTFILIISQTACGQSFNDSIKHKYKFIKMEENTIQNSNSLNHLFDNLIKLKNGKAMQMNVVYIGDSHIQAGDFTGALRKNLQSEFGNAGRGLIVPLKVARTNEPSNYHSSTNIRWQARRNVIANDSIDIGIGGVTIKTSNQDAILNIKVLDTETQNYSYNKIKIFHTKNKDSYDLEIKDNSGALLGKTSDDAERSTFTSSINFNRNVNEINIKPIGNGKSNTSIYGLVLENNNNGILLHSIGVNGAEYRHYNASKYFVEQTTALNPDLFIISLGTNEAYGINFNTNDFLMQIDSLVTALKSANPSATFILTTPGDANKKRKYKNKNNKKAGSTIKEYCTKKNLAYYDLFAVMGGYGSINSWFAKGLTSKDHLHLSVAGYQLQGSLLYNAILDSYQKYEQLQHH